MGAFDEYEFLRDDTLAKEKEWEEQEHFYEMERNKRLPAIIRIITPWEKESLTFKITTNNEIRYN